MKLKEITINKYKSIKNPLVFDFTKNLITIVGTNGSGKTNILEAIFIALKISNLKFYEKVFDFNHILNHEEKPVVSFVIRLESEDFKSMGFDFPEIIKQDEMSVILQEKNCSILIKNELLAKKINAIIEGIEEEIQKIKSLSFKYLNTFKKFCGYSIKDSYFFNNCITINGEMMHNISYIRKTIEDISNQILNSLKAKTKSIAVNNGLIFEFSEFQNLINHNIINSERSLLARLSFEIKYKNIVLPDNFKKMLSLTDEQIETANSKVRKEFDALNFELKELLNELETNVDVIEELFSKINYFVSGSFLDKNYENSSLIQKIINTINPRCFMLTNIIPTKEMLNDKFLEIIDVILRSEGFYENDESILDSNSILKRRDFIIRFINENILSKSVGDFDKQNIKGVFLDEKMNICISELSGERINASFTSLGRIWYLLFKFISFYLKNGDVFILDEPGSYLHPNAQSEILDEINRLIAKKNVKVIFSTHSENMIDIENRDMSLIKCSIDAKSQSTSINQLHISDSINLRSIIGSSGLLDIVFGKNKKWVLVEGATDKAILLFFKTYLNIKNNDYKIFACDGMNICTVSRFLDRESWDFKVILDKDHFFHDMKILEPQNDIERWINNSLHFRKFIKTAKSDEFKYKFVGNKEIEDLISASDSELLTSSNKIDISKINELEINKKEISLETVKNFKEIWDWICNDHS